MTVATISAPGSVKTHAGMSHPGIDKKWPPCNTSSTMTKNTFARRAAAVLAASLLSSSSFATSWSVLGPRPMGMGGAFVALAEGPIAQYWNPAGLAESEGKYGLQVPVGARVEFTGNVLKNANALGDLAGKFNEIEAAQRSGTPGALDADKVAAFYKGLVEISDLNEPGKGALVDVAGGGNIRVGRYALSVNNFTTVGASPFVDTTNIGLGVSAGNTGVSFTGANVAAPANATNAASAASIAGAIGASGYASLNTLTGGAIAAGGITNASELGNALVNFAVSGGQTPAQISEAAGAIAANAGAAAPIIQNAASGNPYTNNRTNLTLRGGSFTEVAFGHGRQVFLPGLKLGGNLKLIFGSVGYQKFAVLDNNSDTGDTLKDFRANTASSVQPAVDLGALWHLNQIFPVLPLNPRVGLVARNINNPKFKQPDLATSSGEGKFPLNGQLRSGAAISPWNFWHVSMDLDLTKNNTPIPGFQSRMWGLGSEVNVFNRSWINIPLRAGLAKNLAETSSKMSYTVGFGLNFLHFMLDVGGAVSSHRTTIDSGSSSAKVPSNLSVAAQLGFVF
ncbi:MAG: hypothetical protein A3J74_02365 [Elusimicrobia bacterium RIFCSPHIGHO2_02_FULL_57_9]|nr:MAG: hypothetical protein A3J74_02365 [Elusimicrobia bacterium RIFCSPHIGHO2_02_FULL_57_9]